MLTAAIVGGSVSEYFKLSRIVSESLYQFEKECDLYLRDSESLSLRKLAIARILKQKHYVYAAYLAAISSYPILGKVCSWNEILSAVKAKVYMICSIKGLDNLNDDYHSRERATYTLRLHHKAFLDPSFSLSKANHWLPKAENSMYALARQVSCHLKPFMDSGNAYKMLVDSLRRYFLGQTASLKQGATEEEVSLNEFVCRVNDKSIGRIWLLVDCCYLERAFGTQEEKLTNVMNNLASSVDYVHKACNIYDDVADLQNDLMRGISNSVIFLAKELQQSHGRRMITDEDLWNTVSLGDYFFLKGIQNLTRLNACDDWFDFKVLVRALNVTRLFAIRKWLVASKNPLNLIRFLRPFVRSNVAALLSRINNTPPDNFAYRRLGAAENDA